MRYVELFLEQTPVDSASANLKKLADAKSKQASQIRKQASAAKKREQIKKSQTELSKILSTPAA
jgi:hypothetical protein